MYIFLAISIFSLIMFPNMKVKINGVQTNKLKHKLYGTIVMMITLNIIVGLPLYGLYQLILHI